MSRSKWSSKYTEKRAVPLSCGYCGNKRNRFVKGTLICVLCGVKLANRANKPKPKPEMVTS